MIFCKAEYRVGFTRCSDCHIDLVEHLPEAKPAPAEDSPRGFEEQSLRRRAAIRGGLDADLAKSVLEAAGIESMTRGDEIAPRYYFGLAALRAPWGIELLVRAEDAEDAVKILDMDATEGKVEEQ